MAEYVQNPPRFRCVQWTGDNQAEVTELYDLPTSGGAFTATWRTNTEGGLDRDPYGGEMGPMWTPLVAADQWVVVGPYWGNDPIPVTPVELLSDPDFQARFETLP